MSKQKNNEFITRIVDLIDLNILYKTQEIKNIIAKDIGYGIKEIDLYFKICTNSTLNSYIKTRQLHFAAEDIFFQPQFSIAEIAAKYHYSEQASFSRAFKKHFGFTPSDVRLKNIEAIRTILSDDDKLLKSTDIETQIKLDEISSRYGTDSEICEELMEIAHKLQLPAISFLIHCLQYQSEFASHAYEMHKITHKNCEELGTSMYELYEICDCFDISCESVSPELIEFYRNI